MTNKVILLVGIPGSGKSSWVQAMEKMLDNDGHTTAVISRDDIRFSMLKDGEDYFAHETEVFNEFIRQINTCMEIGIDYVFVDATHISPQSRRKVLSKLIVDPHTKLSCEVFTIGKDLALERNSKREGLRRVPDGAIARMLDGFSGPTHQEFERANCYGFREVEIKYHPQE